MLVRGRDTGLIVRLVNTELKEADSYPACNIQTTFGLVS
jgi:hypothetical protein